MPIIRIPSVLRSYFDGQLEVQVQGETIKAVMEDLRYCYPSIQEHFFKQDGSLREYIHLYHQGCDIRSMEGMDTKIGAGDIISIVPSIAGG